MTKASGKGGPVRRDLRGSCGSTNSSCAAEQRLVRGKAILAVVIAKNHDWSVMTKRLQKYKTTAVAVLHEIATSALYYLNAPSPVAEAMGDMRNDKRSILDFGSWILD